jgi:hypothetical protein
VVAVTVIAHGGKQASQDVELRADFEAGSPTSRSEVRRRARIGEATRLPLSGGIWSITAQAPGFWASEATVHVPVAGNQAIAVHLWPEATLAARLKLPEPPPIGLKVRAIVETSPGASPTETIGETAISCSIELNRLACRLPATTLDVELRTSGFVSHHLWDLALTPGSVRDLGEVPLQPGTAVSGMVATAGGKGYVTGCRATVLLPSGDPLLLPSKDVASRTPKQFVASVNRRGFYQIANVPPGRYVLGAQLAGWARALRPIEVISDVQTRVATLVLARPAKLTGEVDPPTHPTGTQWRIELVRLGQNPGFEGPSTTVSKSGQWQKADVTPDTYLLSVLGPGDTRWLSQEVVVDADSGPLRLSIPIVRLTGTVKIGRKPLKAAVMFGGRFGAVQIRMDSDEEGTFSGLLPERPSETPRPWTVFVAANDPQVRTTLEEVVLERPGGGDEAHVDLKLPSGLLKGTVADEKGKPIEAIVNVIPLEKSERLVQGSTDRDGHFEITGLPPGQALVVAEARGDVSSAPLTVTLQEQSETQLNVVVHPDPVVSGRVVTLDGEPIPGAQLRAYSTMLPAFLNLTPSTRSGADGRFDLVVPFHAQKAAMVEAGALGFTLRTLPLEVSKKPALIRLEQYGGTLRLEYDRPAVRTSKTPALYLVHESGGHTYVEGGLKSWAEANELLGWEGGIPRPRSPLLAEGHAILEIPQLARGSYALCFMTVPVEMQFLRDGTLPKDCARGFLESLGTLDLSIARR